MRRYEYNMLKIHPPPLSWLCLERGVVLCVSGVRSGPTCRAAYLQLLSFGAQPARRAGLTFHTTKHVALQEASNHPRTSFRVSLP